MTTYDPAAQPEPVKPGEAAFRRDLRRGLDEAGLPAPLFNHPTGGDVWTQEARSPCSAGPVRE